MLQVAGFRLIWVLLLTYAGSGLRSYELPVGGVQTLLLQYAGFELRGFTVFYSIWE